jgi:hypothetical protein
LRNKKQFIIEKFLENPYLDIRKLSLDYYIDYSYITLVINAYKRSITISYPMYCVKSLDLEDTYYLFSDFGEKKIELNKNNNLTEYEKYWLDLNTRLRID